MATTRAETQFRIDYPNSRARASRIFALDAISADALRKIAEDPWVDAHFITVGTGTIDPNIPLEDALILTDANGKAVQLSAELEGADVVVLIGSTPDHIDAAEVIAKASYERKIMLAGLALASGSDASSSAAVVNAMRPFATVLVVSSDNDFIPAMLTALRA